MITIYKKEFRQYFRSMIGYIYLSIFLLISGFYFVTGNLFSQSGDIKKFFSSFSTILVFLIPLITMRTFSEEKKMKTHQLLFTMPILESSIVFGKFFATLSLFLIGMTFTLLYPLILSYYGSFELFVFVGNYLGITLLISTFISIGIFISTLTENQIIAAVVSYSIILGLWLIDSVSLFIVKGSLKTLLEYISIKNGFREFTLGIFNPANIVYYLSLIAFFLFSSIFVLQNRKTI